MTGFGRIMESERCQSCGRFVNPEAVGVSGAMLFDLGPEPDVWGEVFRCPKCTQLHGPVKTNARPPTTLDYKPSYEWINPTEPEPR